MTRIEARKEAEKLLEGNLLSEPVYVSRKVQAVFSNELVVLFAASLRSKDKRAKVDLSNEEVYEQLHKLAQRGACYVTKIRNFEVAFFHSKSSTRMFSTN
jgi:hypothetical protein